MNHQIEILSKVGVEKLKFLQEIRFNLTATDKNNNVVAVAEIIGNNMFEGIDLFNGSIIQGEIDEAFISLPKNATELAKTEKPYRISKIILKNGKTIIGVCKCE